MSRKVFMCLVLLAIASTMGVPSEEKRRGTLSALEHKEVHDKFGQYALRYVTAEGTIVSERGRLVPTTNGTDYVMVVEGKVSYIGDDGKTYVTKYTAGLDGYKVRGTHLPIASVTPAEE